MSIIFNAKTSEAYHIKILAELLSNNLKTGCFEINKDGFILRMMDNNRKTLIDLNLNSENFSLYRFTSKNKLYIGLNLNHFHKMLKSIKKKDSIQLYIDENENTDLAIKAIPKENTRITTSFIKIQNIQNIDIDIPTGYGKAIIILSSEFQKMSKDMLTIGSSIKVSSTESQIKFISDSGGILKRTVQFGENDDDDENTKKLVSYTQEISTEQLSRITKIAGLSTNMQIFSAPDLPLLFRSNVGSLGKISIYIKSKEQIEKENLPNETEYDSE